ncbi:MAG: hypothetical protein JO060_02570 [Candidatus Eremiobacteraeota bacterium]|nr:hypothetical protein [Candidatus Eremiobacteraeota bacterium]
MRGLGCAVHLPVLGGPVLVGGTPPYGEPPPLAVLPFGVQRRDGRPPCVVRPDG